MGCPLQKKNVLSYIYISYTHLQTEYEQNAQWDVVTRIYYTFTLCANFLSSKIEAKLPNNYCSWELKQCVKKITLTVHNVRALLC